MNKVDIVGIGKNGEKIIFIGIVSDALLKRLKKLSPEAEVIRKEVFTISEKEPWKVSFKVMIKDGKETLTVVYDVPVICLHIYKELMKDGFVVVHIPRGKKNLLKEREEITSEAIKENFLGKLLFFPEEIDAVDIFSEVGGDGPITFVKERTSFLVSGVEINAGEPILWAYPVGEQKELPQLPKEVSLKSLEINRSGDVHLCLDGEIDVIFSLFGAPMPPLLALMESNRLKIKLFDKKRGFETVSIEIPDVLPLLGKLIVSTSAFRELVIKSGRKSVNSLLNRRKNLLN